MRPVLLAAIICALILAACSGSPQPTATPVPPTEAAVVPTQVIGNNPIGTLAATIGVPSPGTLVIPDRQGTPNAPTEAPLTFDDVTFTQTGGIAGITLTISLHSDGTYVRNGQTSKVSADSVKQITALLDGIHFFDLQGIFTGPNGVADAYVYSLTVDSPDQSRTITSQDGLTPPELNQIYDALRNLGNGA